MAKLKLKKLQCELEDFETFENPKIELEQYTTSSHIAACVLHTAQFVYADIENKTVADLGCGSGILCIGAALLDAKFCTGFDVDPSAIKLSVQNATDRNVLDRCNFVLCNIKNIDAVRPKRFDTVIMNPPFGTRDKGTDLIFLKSAINLACHAVYSLHKTSTRKKVLNIAQKWGTIPKVIAELRFNLPPTYSFHTQDSVDIQVDLIRFEIMPPKEISKVAS